VDAFKQVIVLAMVTSLAAMCFITFVAVDAIQGAKIPDEESGVVVSKSPVTDGRAADYVISLNSGKVLYIQGNSTLYAELTVGSKYVFTCRIDFLNNMILIGSVKLKD